MAEHSFDHGDSDFAAEAELLRHANRLPKLSSLLRTRVLNAATTAYRQARRWTQARQAAAFLSICLSVSFVLSPLANSSFPRSAWESLKQQSAAPMNLVSRDALVSPQQPNSAWTLIHDRDFLDLPRERPLKLASRNLKSQVIIAHAEPSLPPDKLLTTLQTSDGWAAVQAFDAIRTRSHSTLQRAFAANSF